MNDVLAKEVLARKWDDIGKDAITLRNQAKFADMDAAFWPIYDRVREYTMTSVECRYDLYKAVEYVVRAGIPGAIVECGVWRGGSMMLAAYTLLAMGDTTRGLMLYDTFEGLPYPDGDHDIDILGNYAADRWREGWIKVDEREVARNLESTGYPFGRVQLIKGMVENTLPMQPPAGPIAIARLDTDWEASTRVELEHLWPKLSVGGTLIIDDYGHWLGARKATDEFFADKPARMTRIDYTCRAIQKVA